MNPKALHFIRNRPVSTIALAITFMTIIYVFFFPDSQTKHQNKFGSSVRPRKAQKPIPRDLPGNHIQRFQMNNVKASAQAAQNKEKVLILTPLARFYDEYWANLVALSYPHSAIELGFIVPRTKEGDIALASLDKAIKLTQSSADKFAKITILRQDNTDTLESQSEQDRHDLKVQKQRRSAMAVARNSLVFTTISHDTSWVLWLDSDIIESPATLLQDMTLHNKDIIVANCFQRYIDDQGVESTRAYDFNSWQESEIGLELAASLPEEEIIVEGYNEMATYRALMAYMNNPNEDKHIEVPLDGVGGTALLVKAEVHRDGAMFPPFSFYHLIETEGFAKMAKRLGYQPYGLPNYLVYHYNE
ncbi:putative subunit of Golgi mannosyltransferase complex [Nadsonia fulvescens var. elongata DSM 6958]|uniref:Putative subunit of Golgi mannosyltransferase complex n=1 Tax=Nadsonia fulvescens var. elongata DSM 6958 TaxID=857566 RepID=A0A1E3PMV4_9ASCO|nr:putative subunit of Golgi mannosyltransferase complex [Nadsonia fulvescens var. elongata DSM 6958]